MQFFEVLKELRTEKNLSQKELAQKSGLSQQCISALESQQRYPNSITLGVLAEFFHVSTDYLLGRTDDFGNYIAKTDNILSEEEETLLSYFRKLTDDLKDVAIDTVRALAGATAENAMRKNV